MGLAIINTHFKIVNTLSNFDSINIDIKHIKKMYSLQYILKTPIGKFKLKIKITFSLRCHLILQKYVKPFLPKNFILYRTYSVGLVDW